MTTNHHRRRRTQGQAPRDVGLGDYPAVATEVIAALGPTSWSRPPASARRAGARRRRRLGQRRDPRRPPGADVVATDLTPELFDIGRQAAAEAAGVELRWEEADAEALPFADGEFDTVMSCVGVMFAPHHQATADELVRVARPGRHHRPAQLDAGGLHRPDVRHHEAVRAAAAAGCAAAAAVGRRGPRARPVRRPGHRRRRPRRQTLRVDRVRAAPTFRDYFKAQLRPHHRGLQGHRRRPGRTAALDAALGRARRPVPRATAPWSGSTCCSPPAAPDPRGWVRALARGTYPRTP